MSARWLLIGLTLIGCDSKAKEVERCRYLVPAERVGECLVSRFNWDVHDASLAGLDALRDKFAHEDSLRDTGAAE